MKAAVIEIGREDAQYAPEPEAVKNALRAWLDDKPDASIEHVMRAPVSSEGYSVTNRLLMAIFYRG